jgi:hypothetical protein
MFLMVKNIFFIFIFSDWIQRTTIIQDKKNSGVQTKKKMATAAAAAENYVALIGDLVTLTSNRNNLTSENKKKLLADLFAVSVQNLPSTIMDPSKVPNRDTVIDLFYTISAVAEGLYSFAQKTKMTDCSQEGCCYRFWCCKMEAIQLLAEKQSQALILKGVTLATSIVTGQNTPSSAIAEAVQCAHEFQSKTETEKLNNIETIVHSMNTTLNDTLNDGGVQASALLDPLVQKDLIQIILSLSKAQKIISSVK